jgi:hypothetical protein
MAKDKKKKKKDKKKKKKSGQKSDTFSQLYAKNEVLDV